MVTFEVIFGETSCIVTLHKIVSDVAIKIKKLKKLKHDSKCLWATPQTVTKNYKSENWITVCAFDCRARARNNECLVYCECGR